MKIPSIAKYIGGVLVGTSIAITAVHSHNNEPLSDLNPKLAQGDKDFDERLSVAEWIPLLARCDENGDGVFSREEYDKTEELLEGTFIEAYHHNVRETGKNFYLAREMMLKSRNSEELLEWMKRSN
ncbi:MAG: hypothetical protein HYZ79_07640 [Candidatus Melainabacteria bacterium]|nr:hypothetical protein [Candidatus Melainabacteria bacterium]